MKLTLFQVDAFTSRLFGGNPAAIIPLKQWLPKQLLQQIALENNLSETAFLVPGKKKGVHYEIRWFTPEVEVNLCGHATLAAAWVVFNKMKTGKRKLVFNSESGLLSVTKKKDLLWLDFPSWKPERLDEYPERLQEIVGVKEILGVYRYRDLLVEVASEEEVRNARPDFTALARTGQMLILTAPGKDCDFVSRFFAPSAGINEDPVTGSAHSQLIPFWQEKFGKSEMTARQLSHRGGELICRQLNDNRVGIGGNCVFYMKGELRLPQAGKAK